MPILFFLKNPPVTLASKGMLDKTTCKLISKQLKCILVTAVDNQPMLIPTEKDTNIGYIKQITQENFKDMEEKRKEGQKGGRIVRPEFNNKFLGRKGH